MILEFDPSRSNKNLTPDVEEMNKQFKIIQDGLRATKSRQKNYVDNCKRDLEFAVREKVFLKLTPHRGKAESRRKGKLAPRYIRAFQIMRRIDKVAQQLVLPEELIGIHDIFHVSQLKKHNLAPDHVLNDEMLSHLCRKANSDCRTEHKRITWKVNTYV